MASSTKPTINTYISDMLALEQHMLVPVEHQTKDDAVAKYPAAARVIQASHEQITSHITALQARLEAVGGHAGSPIKSGVASAVGAAAVAVSNARKTEVSKYLRDDYSAFALASAGYTMLHTTALALGDTATASLAQNHLTDLATSVMRISNTLPIVVLGELQEEGVTVDPSVLSEADKNVDDAWKEGGSRSAN